MSVILRSAATKDPVDKPGDPSPSAQDDTFTVILRLSFLSVILRSAATKDPVDKPGGSFAFGSG